LAVEWIKSQLQLARGGDKNARRKLLVLAAGVAIAVVLFVSGQTQTKPIRIQPTKSVAGKLVSSAGFVHLSGAVLEPGVYPIKSGTRLFEVIALAGGFTKNADQDSVNLARVLTDGEQILVGRGGQAPVSDGLIHLNSATVADLDKLPGLGPTLAARIIDWREANKGFKSVDDLRKIGGIGDKLFAGLRKLVAL
jgi:competence protein ComEA